MGNDKPKDTPRTDPFSRRGGKVPTGKPAGGMTPPAGGGQPPSQPKKKST